MENLIKYSLKFFLFYYCLAWLGLFIEQKHAFYPMGVAWILIELIFVIFLKQFTTTNKPNKYYLLKAISLFPTILILVWSIVIFQKNIPNLVLVQIIDVSIIVASCLIFFLTSKKSFDTDTLFKFSKQLVNQELNLTEFYTNLILMYTEHDLLREKSNKPIRMIPFGSAFGFYLARNFSSTDGFINAALYLLILILILSIVMKHFAYNTVFNSLLSKKLK